MSQIRSVREQVLYEALFDLVQSCRPADTMNIEAPDIDVLHHADRTLGYFNGTHDDWPSVVVGETETAS